MISHTSMQHYYLLAIDQGTTSTRALLFDQKGNALCSAQQLFRQYFPDDGWVEHNPADLWGSTVSVCHQVLDKGGIRADAIAAIGITNQRETTLVWDRHTGEPIYNAIVWQDRRTAAYCRALIADKHEALIQSKTGLLVDPYFSASKLRWLLDNIAGARERAERWTPILSGR